MTGPVRGGGTVTVIQECEREAPPESALVAHTKVNFPMTPENPKLSRHHNETTTTTAHVVVVVTPDTSSTPPMVKSITAASPISVVTAVTESPLAPKAGKSSSSSSSSSQQQQRPLSYRSSGPTVSISSSTTSEIDEDEQDEVSSQVMTYYPHWDFVARWNELTQKRMDLCRQRVHLEQRLFEFAELRRHRNQNQTEWHPFRDPTAAAGGALPYPACTSTPAAAATAASCDADDGASTATGGSGSSTTSLSKFPTLCSTRWEQVNFPDGQVYEGQVLVVLRRNVTQVEEKTRTRRLLGMAPSKERTTERTKVVTTTEWIRHGHGCNRWPDGQVYRGSWHWNSRHGRGTHTWPDGRTVTGGWRAGHLHGRIFFSWPDSSTFDGDAAFGKKHGRGVHTWAAGKRVYSGQYENGLEQGFGTLVEQDVSQSNSINNSTSMTTNAPEDPEGESGGSCIQGSGSGSEPEQQIKYRGQFVAGKRHGYGVQIWMNKTYDGEWEANMVHGHGKLIWHMTGASYTGEFNYGRYHGNGCYQHPVGKKYVGEWYHGRKQGQGQQHWPDGTVYHGQFARGKRDGYGRIVYPDGSSYSGGWSKGRRSGHGIQVDAHGVVVHCGRWIKNHPAVKVNTMRTTTLPLVPSWTMNSSSHSTTTSNSSLASSRRRRKHRSSKSSSRLRSYQYCVGPKDDHDLAWSLTSRNVLSPSRWNEAESIWNANWEDEDDDVSTGSHWAILPWEGEDDDEELDKSGGRTTRFYTDDNMSEAGDGSCCPSTPPRPSQQG